MRVTLYITTVMLLAVALLVVGGCDGLDANKPYAATPEVGPPLPEPPVDNPVVEFAGRMFYLNARRVWCEISSKLSTLTTRGGTKFHRFDGSSSLKKQRYC